MRVLNPGPGEIVDRLTVVARKIVEGGERGEHFKDEMMELVQFYNNNCRTIDGAISLVISLAAINAAIWQREDELRAYRLGKPPGTTDFTQLAFRIQELNDRRADLVKQINVAAGIVREEKL